MIMIIYIKNLFCKVIILKMKKKFILSLLLIISLLPTIVQFIVKYLGNYFLGLLLRIFVHFIIPIIVVSLIYKISLKKSFLIPLKIKNKRLTIYYSILGSLFSLLIIILAFFLFKSTIDFPTIALALEKINVTKSTYLFVALAIILINPFLEEYFWRGFIYRSFEGYRFSFLTGILFALHHVMIISSWFNLWQFLLVTLFLSFVGIYFNHIYKKTGSIYSSLIIHTTADIIIVLIGYFMIF
jgi:membrane protease YdiL (CAAX protease family)